MRETLQLLWAYDPAGTVWLLVLTVGAGLALLLMFVALVDSYLK
jgi:hypothetical protein